MLSHQFSKRRVLLTGKVIKVSVVLLLLSALTLLASLPTFAAAKSTKMQRSPSIPARGVLNGSSNFGPGATISCLSNDAGTATIAWTDFNHHLNAVSDVQEYLTPWNYQVFSDTSTNGPSIVCYQGKYILAWTANDSSHRLFVAQWDGGNDNNLTNRVTLNDTSLLSPTLAISNGVLFLAWKGLTNNHIFFASSGDGVTWSQGLGITDTTTAPPALASFNGQLYVAWAGTDNPNTIWFGAFTGSSQLAHHGHFAQQTDVRPGLVVYNNKLFIMWSDSNARINLGVSTDGLSFQYLYTRTDTTYNDLSLILWAQTGTSPITLGFVWTGTNQYSTIYIDVTAGS